MNLKYELKRAILEFLKKHPGATFDELDVFLAHEFEHELKPLFNHEEMYVLHANENVVAWFFNHKIVYQAYKELFEENRLIASIGDLALMYYSMGRMLALPVAKHNKPYKTTRWLPMCLSAAIV
jgi:hypothetical protein